ncbi:MAG: hypothetical protein KGQ40_11780, partial [Rhodospirillales bacterium]|nr:hypothetical protein [Rhodospirillales bacterium]
MAVAGIAVAGLAATIAGLAPSTAARAQSAPPAGPAIPVTATAATRRDLPVLLTNIGAVQGLQSVLVR